MTEYFIRQISLRHKLACSFSFSPKHLHRCGDKVALTL